jgi:hypothetical protein
LKLMLENRFPRVWTPSPENRDLRQLFWHRHRLVQVRTRVINQLQALALNEGIQRKTGLWSQKGRAQLESLRLAPWATRRRQDLLELLDRLTPSIEELSRVIEREAQQRAEVQLLMTHPGAWPLTALAYVLVIGSLGRFRCGKQIGSHLGLIPCEDSSGGHQRPHQNRGVLEGSPRDRNQRLATSRKRLGERGLALRFLTGKSCCGMSKLHVLLPARHASSAMRSYKLCYFIQLGASGDSAFWQGTCCGLLFNHLHRWRAT